MGKLILLRHGESEWNRLNLFTGWVDVPLSKKGIDEALRAGELIREIPIDAIFTSTLIRGQMTAMLAMSRHLSGKVPVIKHAAGSKLEEWGNIYGEEARTKTIPVFEAWELNERYYGELQGLNKAETAAKYGADQVKIWRRSYDTAPPKGESLAMTAARSIPYFQKEITAWMQRGSNVLVSAHGNSLRSIIMHLDGLSRDEVLSLEIATGVPIVYDCRNGSFVRDPAALALSGKKKA